MGHQLNSEALHDKRGTDVVHGVRHVTGIG